MDLDSAREAIVGVWRLVDYGDRDRESDAWTPTFGRVPTGILLYHSSGLLSAQVAAPADDPTASLNYVGYIGTYMLKEAHADGDEIRGVVDHHMDVAFPPELLEEEPDRMFRVVGDRLTLGDGQTSRRLFERVV
jgi:hypothetical protein